MILNYVPGQSADTGALKTTFTGTLIIVWWKTITPQWIRPHLIITVWSIRWYYHFANWLNLCSRKTPAFEAQEKCSAGILNFTLWHYWCVSIPILLLKQWCLSKHEIKIRSIPWENVPKIKGTGRAWKCDAGSLLFNKTISIHFIDSHCNFKASQKKMRLSYFWK